MPFNLVVDAQTSSRDTTDESRSELGVTVFRTSGRRQPAAHIASFDLPAVA
jgi:hypothetical protein